MGLFIGIIVAVVLAGLIYGKFGKAKLAALFAAIVIAISVATSSLVMIPTGYTGILTTFGKVNEQRTLDAGPNFIAPWQDVIKMNNQVQKFEKTFKCFTSDLQETSVVINVSHRINQSSAMKIYKNIGKDYIGIVIDPAVYEIVKNYVGKYNAEDLISSRETVQAEIFTALSKRLAESNIVLDGFSLIDVDFTDTFTDAVEAKAQAEQNAQKAIIQANQKREEAQVQADIDVINANAAAEKQKLAADAELYAAQQKAEANRVLNESLTGSLLQYYEIMNVDSKWNGQLPEIMGADSVMPIIE